jgi:hypothetical protein
MGIIIIKKSYYFVGLEILTAVVMNSSISWDVTPCSSLKVNRCFGEIFHLHLHGPRISQAKNQIENRWQ